METQISSFFIKILYLIEIYIRDISKIIDFKYVQNSYFYIVIDGK